MLYTQFSVYNPGSAPSALLFGQAHRLLLSPGGRERNLRAIPWSLSGPKSQHLGSLPPGAAPAGPGLSSARPTPSL